MNSFERSASPQKGFERGMEKPKRNSRRTAVSMVAAIFMVGGSSKTAEAYNNHHNRDNGGWSYQVNPYAFQQRAHEGFIVDQQRTNERAILNQQRANEQAILNLQRSNEQAILLQQQTTALSILKRVQARHKKNVKMGSPDHAQGGRTPTVEEFIETYGLAGKDLILRDHAKRNDTVTN